jgi:hypothetical protein
MRNKTDFWEIATVIKQHNKYYEIMISWQKTLGGILMNCISNSLNAVENCNFYYLKTLSQAS